MLSTICLFSRERAYLSYFLTWLQVVGYDVQLSSFHQASPTSPGPLLCLHVHFPLLSLSLSDPLEQTPSSAATCTICRLPSSAQRRLSESPAGGKTCRFDEDTVLTSGQQLIVIACTRFPIMMDVPSCFSSVLICSLPTT